jgi:hypothetical protein
LHALSFCLPQAVGKQGQALQEVRVEALGFCERPGSAKFLPGGTDKLPEDFVRPVQLVSEEQAATAALTTQVRAGAAPLQLWARGEHAQHACRLRPAAAVLPAISSPRRHA